MTSDRWTSGAGYDQWMGRWSRLLAHKFLDWLSLPAGLRWLDVCCGSGVVSEAIVERNNPAAVVGVDISPEQIAFARQHRATANVRFEVNEGSHLPFDNASFDVVVCGLGLNYISDAEQGLKEFSRVTCSGGTIAAYLWDYEDGARFLREFWNAAIAVDSKALDFDQAVRFPICTEDGLLSVFRKANLQHLVIYALEITTRFTSFDDYWDPLFTGQGSAPNYLLNRDPGTQRAIRDRLRSMLPIDSQGAIELPARAWAIRGRRP